MEFLRLSTLRGISRVWRVSETSIKERNTIYLIMLSLLVSDSIFASDNTRIASELFRVSTLSNEQRIGRM